MTKRAASPPDAVFDSARKRKALHAIRVNEVSSPPTCSLRATDANGRTALHRAAAAGCTTDVQSLLARGADVGVADPLGYTPLHLAALHSPEVSTMAALVDGGAVVDAASRHGLTALHLAAQGSTSDVVAFLISKGAALHPTGAGCTPLHRAAQFNPSPAVASTLIDAGADCEAVDSKGRTPLHLAAMSNTPDVVRCLVSRRCRVDSRDAVGRTPLLMAMFNSHTGVAELLLHAGASVNALDNTGHGVRESARNWGES